jgi:hypothetical protein
MEKFRHTSKEILKESGVMSFMHCCGSRMIHSRSGSGSYPNTRPSTESDLQIISVQVDHRNTERILKYFIFLFKSKTCKYYTNVFKKF